MIRVFISYPFSSDPEGCRRAVAAIARRLALAGQLPLAPQIYVPHFLREAKEREVALRVCLGLVALADEVRVYGPPSEGMVREIGEARRLGIPVVERTKPALR